MNISFVVISNGAKVDKTILVLKSIFYQNVPEYEILLCGKFPIDSIPAEISKKINYIKEYKGAADGRLGDMRNRACAHAQYDNITVLDDDMVLSMNWYKNLLKLNDDFDILTSKVILPEGTRFWDHTCYQSPKYGHVILEASESDGNLYMSGGQAWVMKKHVFEKAAWDVKMSTGARANMKNIQEYSQGKHNEDTDFSKKCRDNGFKIKHNHEMIAFHNDESYSCVGRICNPRPEGRSYKWVKALAGEMYQHPEKILEISKKFFQAGRFPEAADVIR